MIIFLTGNTGYLGSYYKKYLELNKIKHFCIGRYITSSKNTLINFLKIHINQKKEPYYLINAAGFSGKPNVDGCEDYKRECLESNVILPSLLSDVCQELDIILVHVSSGCVYNGYEKIWIEDDPSNFNFRANNCSWYSGTKALAEELLEDNKNSYILRLRFPFDSDLDSLRNYLRKLINYPKIVDSLNSITNIQDFTNVTFDIINKNLPFGKYNIFNEEPVYTKEVINILNKHLNLEKKQWFDSIEEFQKTVKAKRTNCVLSTEKLKSFGIVLDNAYDSIEKCVLKYKENRIGK